MKQNWLSKQVIRVADMMLKPGFIVFFVCDVLVWILWNTLAPKVLQIDAWPFQGLNLFMSALAGIQATVIGIAMAIHAIKTEQRDQETHDVVMQSHAEQHERLERIEKLLEEKPCKQ